VDGIGFNTSRPACVPGGTATVSESACYEHISGSQSWLYRPLGVGKGAVLHRAAMQVSPSECVVHLFTIEVTLNQVKAKKQGRPFD
jgi:hypothetical protein